MLFGLMLCQCLVVWGQKPSLVLTGAIIDVTPAGPLKEPLVIKSTGYERQETYFEIRVRLTYFNRGDETLIVPTPVCFNYGKKRLLFFEIPANDGKVLATADEWVFASAGDRSTELLKMLNLEEPPRGMFAIIEPGGYYEATDIIRAKGGFKLAILISGDKLKRDLELAVAEHPFFKVRYNLSLNSNAVAEARRRWRSLGRLVFDTDGDFSIESQIIVNKPAD